MSQASSSSFSPGKKTRKNRRPPARLSWPSSLSKNTSTRKSTNKSSSALDKKPTARKRPRISNDDANTHAEMWVDKYTPCSSAELCVAPKKVKEIKAWLNEAAQEMETSGGTKKKLLILVGSPGIGKSATARVLVKELRLSLRSWTESFVPRARGTHTDAFMSVEQSSATESFEEFLRQSGAGFSSLHMQMAGQNEERCEKSLILLEDLPNLHGRDAELKFRKIMSQHLTRSQVPTVLIFSDVCEGKHKPNDLERLIDRDELYSPTGAVTILQIHAVTKPKMKKVLDGIAKKENCKVPATLFEELHYQSGGDMRHAIMTLQLHSTGLRSVSNVHHNDRDVKLSTFHALGKLLYAKRNQVDGRSVLAFKPEEIMERSDLGVGNSLRFLEYHSTDFFSDISELSDAYERFSDAAVLLDQPMDRHRGDLNFPDGCASSIAGRAVANTNTKPTPNKFRQFSTPKVFHVIRNRKQNQIVMDQLSRRLSSCHLSLSNVVGSTNTFVTEMLPWMRVILPREVNPSVDNLYSVARETIQSQARKREATEQEDPLLKEQEEILEMDDIVNFDSDEDTTSAPATQSTYSEIDPYLHSTLGSRASAIQRNNHSQSIPSQNSPTSTVKGPSQPTEQEIIVIDD